MGCLEVKNWVRRWPVGDFKIMDNPVNMLGENVHATDMLQRSGGTEHLNN